MPPDDPLRQAQLEAEGSHLVLEEIPKWLDQFEFEIVGQSAHVVVELDRGSRPVGGGAALDHVRIERALREELRPFDFAGLVGKTLNEGLADSLPLLLRLGDAGQVIEEFLLARERSAATTAESTPPERPQMTRSLPTRCRTSAITLCAKSSSRQEPEQPQTEVRKFFRIVPPAGVWVTSGWNCRP